jgi:Protein kinase domain
MTAGLLATDPAALGPYRLLGRLGGGGMGQVYLAESPGGELAAVKVIRPEFAADPEFRVRFTREVANARNVSGMYTALLVDADTEGPVPWLATAYIAGPPLSDAVRDSGPLPLPSLLPLATGLAKALAAIHAAGVVHRRVARRRRRGDVDMAQPSVNASPCAAAKRRAGPAARAAAGPAAESRDPAAPGGCARLLP